MLTFHAVRGRIHLICRHNESLSNGFDLSIGRVRNIHKSANRLSTEAHRRSQTRVSSHLFRKRTATIGQSFTSNRDFVSKHDSSHSPLHLTGAVDRYRGIFIDMEEQNQHHLSDAEFEKVLTDCLCKWREDKLTCVWLRVPIGQGRVMSVAGGQGFTFHHAEGSVAVLNLWLRDDLENKVPRFATHQVGVSGIVLNEETREVLCVKDKNKKYSSLWKFPGGLSDLGEDIKDTAEREVFEETGVRAEFQSILAFRQQHTQPGAFGRSDLYFLCRLRPLTFDLNPCETEIEACQWMDVSRLVENPNTSTLTHTLASLILKGLEEGFESVDMKSNTHTSIYKGLKYQLFHQPL